MPVATNHRSNLINEEFYNKFLDKMKVSHCEPSDDEFWETQLASEARMTFNLLPQSAYEEFVFRNLDAITGLTKSKFAPSKFRGKGSKESLKKSLTGSGSIRSFGSRIKSLSLLDSSTASLNDHDFNAQSRYNLQLKCLEIISSGERIKSFSESGFEAFWNSFESILLTGFADDSTAKNIITKISEINQNWLLKKISAVIDDSGNECSDHILKYSSSLQLKLYPEEDLDDSMLFLEKISNQAFKSPQISSFLADVLFNLQNNCETESVYPKLQESVLSITDRFTSNVISNFKISQDHMKLLCAALCLSGKEMFLFRFDEIVGVLLVRLREKFYDYKALSMLNELLRTYYNRYPDAWATLLDRTESICIQIFPNGRKNVLGCDESVELIVEILRTVSKKLPRFCYHEIIKKLLKQSHQSQNLENFPWDRTNIALQTFLFLCANLMGSCEGTRWREELAQARIGDLEMESMSREVTELLKLVINRLSKSFWIPHLNELVFDLGKTKQMQFLKMILEKYELKFESTVLMKLADSNAAEIARVAKRIVTKRNCAENEILVHKIGNMVFGQMFKLDFHDEQIVCEENRKVYKFFSESFERGHRIISEIPENLQDNEILRGGIFFILESLTSWSQNKLSDANGSGKLDADEIELFGKVVDVYFRLLSKYETLVKTVYLEKQSDKNLILRSWSSLVGFKRSSKETADFLVSLLGYADARLRQRMIESLKLLPQNRLMEFMKLLERFRLPVSEDFVNLKRGRRNERAKLEITQVYRNILVSLRVSELSNLTPLRMILRHVIEIYYFVTKSEPIDEFIWTMRGQFCCLLREYLKIINSMTAITRKSFLPLKFHLEVWLTVEEWTRHMNSSLAFAEYLKDLDELLAHFTFNLIAAVVEVDRTSLISFVDNLMQKVTMISSDPELKSSFIYNLFKSCGLNEDNEGLGLVFMKFMEFIGSGRDGDSKIQEGIQRVLNEFEGISERLNQNAYELFKLMQSESVVFSSDPCGVLEFFPMVTDAKLQRRILNKLRLQSFNSESRVDIKVVKVLYVLSGQLMETFPNSLRSLWQSFTTSGDLCENFALIIHFLVEKLENNLKDDVAVFIYNCLEDKNKELCERIVNNYSHPFSGTKRRFNHTPIEAYLRLKDSRVSCLNYLFTAQNDLKPEELVDWATGCPLKEVSLKAWGLIFGKCDLMTDEFISAFLLKSKSFLQHLVCPSTHSYFDPTLVKQVLRVFQRVVEGNGNVRSETIGEIHKFASIQLLAAEEIVFVAACDLIKVCYEKIEDLRDERVDLLVELAKRPSISIDLIFYILQKQQQDFGSKEFFCYLFSFLPFLFRLFEEKLDVSHAENEEEEVYDAEMAYLRRLIAGNQIILSEFDENSALDLLELRDFLLSVEKMRKRPSVDFYKSLALILANLPETTLKLVLGNCEFSDCYEKFIIFYFDDLRRKRLEIVGFEEEKLRIATILARGKNNEIMRQRVIDFLTQ